MGKAWRSTMLASITLFGVASVGCAGGGETASGGSSISETSASSETSLTPTTVPTIAQLDLPPVTAPPAPVLDPVDPDAIELCDVLAPELVDRLIGTGEPAALTSSESTAVVDPFGDIRTCRWSSSTSRGLTLGVTAAGPGPDDLLGVSLLTDAALDFERGPVTLGDAAVVQVADSSSQGVSRLCVAADARGVLWLACLEHADERLALNGPERDELVDILAVSFEQL